MHSLIATSFDTLHSHHTCSFNMTLMGLIETPVEHGLFYLCVSLLVYTALWQTRGTDFVTMVLHNLSLRRSRYDQLLWEFGLLEKKFEDQLNEDRVRPAG